jgi:integrase
LLHDTNKSLELAMQPPQSEAAVGAADHTLLDLCNAYVADLADWGKKSARSSESITRNHIAPTSWANAPARLLSPNDAGALLRQVIVAVSARTAQRVYYLLGASYSHALARPSEFPDITRNPMLSLKTIKCAPTRQAKILSESELGHLVLDISAERSPARMAILFSLLLGGQSLTAVLNTVVDDVNLLNKTIELHGPKGARRDSQSLRLPLTPEAAKIGFDLFYVALANNSRLLFRGSNAEHPLSMSAISALIHTINANFASIGVTKKPFLMRDLRATMSDRMAAIGIDRDTRHRVQGRATDENWYRSLNRTCFIEEKRDALTRVANDLRQCATAAATAWGLTWSGFEVLDDPASSSGLVN